MRYTDLIENYGFARNMQETNWLKLFPHWWSENDPLLETIGKEVAFLKAQGVFTLLNTMVKPPVLIWQTSVVEKEYTISDKITTLSMNEDNTSNVFEIQAPLYKTFGSIQLVNHSEENVRNLKVAFTDDDYILIKNTIQSQDKININIGDQKVTINGKKANIDIIGEGVSYFKTQKQVQLNKWNSNLHYFSNEVLRIAITSDRLYDVVDMDIDIILDNVVFINEQNIEINGLELVPIKSIDIYAYYDFPFNPKVSGWQKVSEKVYIESTNVIYDMITTKFNTKKFYVDVWYKGLDYPYRVGFPADKNADDESIYHVNKELDTWGEYFGLKRRFYKENIPEEDYPYTYPEYYPYNIEQDYWYYQRLINEYTYTEWAVNDVDLLDTDGTPIVRLHSIDPFVEDLVVHAKTIYPENENDIRTQNFTPIEVSQTELNDGDSEYRKSQYRDIQNLLKYDENKTYITLRNKIGAGITYQQYLSKVLQTFFDLKDLPEDVHINDLQILIEAEATDNKDNKYSNDDTGLIIPGVSETHVFPLKQDSIYELAEKEITYNLSLSMKDILSYIEKDDYNVLHEAIIGKFQGIKGKYMDIPFTLKENDEIVNDITEVYVTFDGLKTVEAQYYYDNDQSYIKVFVPSSDDFDTISIACKTLEHSSFVASKIPIKHIESDIEEDEDPKMAHSIYGPIREELQRTMTYTDEWHTNDLRNILQKEGIYFVNVFQNDDETNTPTILIKNISLKVSYSPKQTEFELNTQVTYQATKPAIAKLQVQVTNTGDKDFVADVDIVSATNLRLQPKTYFNVDLKMGDSHTEYIDIIPEYPIIDGQYEILTVCEDKVRTNTVMVSSSGLVKTSVVLDDHYGTLGEDITFKAKVINTTQDKIEDYGKISFYIDGYYIGSEYIVNNIATFTLTTNNDYYKYITPGLHNLEARFSGTVKHASSRSYAYLSVLRTDIIMDITETNDSVVYGQKYQGVVSFYILDSNGDRQPFIPNAQENNKVTFYIDDIDIGSMNINEYGKVNFVSDDITIPPGTYTLSVNYHGNNHYVQQHQTKEIYILGGKTTTTVFDIKAKPTDQITLQAKVVDSLGIPLAQGIVTFYLDDVEIGTTNVTNGIAFFDYTAPTLEDGETEKIYNIIAYYTDTIYQPSQGTNILTVAKGNVNIENISLFNASQFEPLGFYFKVIDVATNEPVTDGKITVTIPGLNIVCENNVDPDGGVRIIYNIVNFSSKDLKELLDFAFFKHYESALAGHYEEQQILSYIREEEPILMDFDLEDNHLMFKYKLPAETIETVDEDNIIVNELPPGFEQVYIGEDNHLYARTNIDILRRYIEGTFPINITYTSEYLYNSFSKDGTLKIVQQDTNIDLMSYDLMYNEQNESLTCYVNEYNLLDDVYRPINQGSVQFFVDNVKIGQADVVNGTSVLPPSILKDVQYGNHLLQAIYVPMQGNRNTYTYTSLQLRKIPSYFSDVHFVTQLKGRKNELDLSICINEQYAMAIEGEIEIYINNTKVLSDYLFGIESSSGWIAETGMEINPGNCTYLSYLIDIPDDADINNYEITVKYLGNDYIEECQYTLPFVHTKIPTELKVSNSKVAQGEIAKLDVKVVSSLNDFINEGYISLWQDNQLITKSKVKNNKVSLIWTPSNQDGYTVKYTDADHYEDSMNIVTIEVIEPLTDIYIYQDNQDINFDTTDKEIMTDINEALQCIAVNGTIHLVNEVVLKDSITIDKNINIIGYNDAKVIKDIDGLLINDNSNIKMYNYDEFEEVMYEIIGLSPTYINDRDFCIIENDLYYISSNNDLVPIFLMDDGNFYSYELRALSSIVRNINININAEVNIKNINFITNDSDNIDDFVITNRGNLNIRQCVLNKYVSIINYGTANINGNLVYCNIKNYGIINKDNNWWGSNTISDESINNHIILTIWTDEDPAVIGEDIHIYGQLIGANGIEYDLPQVEFFFEADNGFFAVDNGYTMDNKIDTVYLDSIEEGKIYCTVDNETVTLDILNYDRKTEILLESFDIPIGYQVTFKAKIHSCADHYYDNKIVDNGYATFYLDGKKIGYANVESGEAKLSTFISSNEYIILNQNDIDQYNGKLTVTYTPNDYYFASKSEINVCFINPSDVCYVSPTGNNDNNGTFNMPVQSIAKAIQLNRRCIYLKEGIYNDVLTDLTNENILLKKYYGDVIFSNHDQPIFSGVEENTVQINMEGLIFADNNSSIADNINSLILNHCIIQNNDYNYMFFDCKNISIDNSVILLKENTVLLNNVNRRAVNYEINHVWYGVNLDERDDIESIVGMAFPTTYIVMNANASKDILYTGTVAKIIGSLNRYKRYDDEDEFDYEDTLPIRTAFFRTDVGTIMPTKDNTYNNQAIAFLNTLEESKNDDVIITFPNNTNYTNANFTIKCYATDIYGEEISNDIYFKIIDNHNSMVTDGWMYKKDDIHIFESASALPLGTYTLYCRNGDIRRATEASIIFDVVTPYIQVKECNLIDDTYLYNMTIDLKCTDPFDNNIQNQEVSFYIDDVFIDDGVIRNGSLYQTLNYNNIPQGQHTLKITTKGYQSSFAELNYYKNFNSTKKSTKIVFDATTLAPNESTDLIIKVLDDKDKLVKTGYIDIKFDGDIVYTDDNGKYTTTETVNDKIELQNGIGVIYDFSCDVIGQHFMTIHYSGDDDYYKASLINPTIKVGVDEVIMTPAVTPITVQLDKPLMVDFMVTDQSHRQIKRGNVEFFLNNISIGIETVQDGMVSYNQMLPVGVLPNTNHMLTLVYHDPQNKYADTTVTNVITINSIATQILIDTIYSSPGFDETIDYDLECSQGSVLTGTLVAKYDGNEIGRAIVSSSNRQITLHIPKIDTNNVAQILFEYTNENDIYNNSQTSVSLVLNKTDIKINTSASSYYPKQIFNFYAYCTDVHNQDLLDGEITLYIDNVKHSTQNIINGEAIFSLKLNNVQDYRFSLVYEEDEYYNKTVYEQTFSVNNIPITNIAIDNLSAKINSLHEILLTFVTENGLKVNDGYIDFYLNNQKINTYSVMLDPKYMQLNIPNMPYGTYELEVRYYGSSTFDDYRQTYDFAVTSLLFDVTVNDIVAELNDDIDIVTSFIDDGEPVYLDGTLEYYLQTNGGRRFIGIEAISNQHTHTYTYTLPNDLDQSTYDIIVCYTGDPQHMPQQGQGTLSIQRSYIELSNIDYSNTIEYQHNVILNCNTNILGIHNFDVGLKKNDTTYYLGTATSENGIINFTHKLESQFGVGEYTIILYSPPSIIFNEFEREFNITVEPTTPTIIIDETKDYEATFGGYFTLPHEARDNNNISIDGTFSYILNNEELSYDNNYRTILNYYAMPIRGNTIYTIDIMFEPNDENFVATFGSVAVIMKKNKVNVEIDMGNKDEVYRGETDIPLDINLISPTTTENTYYLPYEIRIEDTVITRENGKIEIPLDLPDKNQYVLRIVSTYDNHNVFESFDESFILKNVHPNVVTVSDTDDATTASTLSRAFDLVGDYGTIVISKDIENDACINTKNVNIITYNGNLRTLANCPIQNDGILHISNLILRANSTSAITNNNELYVDNCIFEDNHAQYGAAIYIDNKNKNTEITNCQFTNNTASLYGGAIFSNKGNDVTIQYCEFGEFNCAVMHGSSISTNGNMYIKDNIFYKQYGYNGDCEIYVMNGSVELQGNYFDATIKTICNVNGSVSANLNYWGYNDIVCIDHTYDGIVTIDSWLVSSCEVHYTEPQLGMKVTNVIARIHQYMSRSEPEITDYKDIYNSNKIPIYLVGDNIDKDYLTRQLETTARRLYVGQQEFKLIEEHMYEALL